MEVTTERPTEEGFYEGFCPKESKFALTPQQVKEASPVPGQKAMAVVRWMNMAAEDVGVITAEESNHAQNKRHFTIPLAGGEKDNIRVYFFPGERGFSEKDREKMLNQLGQDRKAFAGKWTTFPGSGLDAEGQVFKKVTGEITALSLDQIAERYDALCDFLVAYNPKLEKHDPEIQVLGNEEGGYFLAMSQKFLQAAEKCEKIGIDAEQDLGPNMN